MAVATVGGRCASSVSTVADDGNMIMAEDSGMPAFAREGYGEAIRREPNRKDLVRWILSWQPDVKVLAPAKLRERVEEKMRAGLGQ